jgi:hypothetical protein
MENSKTMGVTCNIGWPSYHHIHAHWTRWKHWSLHDSWDNKIIESFTQHLSGDSWTRYFWTYYFQIRMWINFQSTIIVPPCSAYPKIFTRWIKVETLMMDLVIPCGYFVSYCRFADGGGFWWVAHSNQDTQASIESYHEALKRCSFLETKEFQGWWIDC